MRLKIIYLAKRKLLIFCKCNFKFTRRKALIIDYLPATDYNLLKGIKGTRSE